MARRLVRYTIAVRGGTGEAVLAEQALVQLVDPVSGDDVMSWAAETGGTGSTLPIRSSSTGEVARWVDEATPALLTLEVAADGSTVRAGTATALTFPPFEELIERGAGDAGATAALAGGVALKPQLSDWFAKLRAATVANPVDVVWITDSLGALGTNAEPAHPWQTTNALNELVGSVAPPVAVFAQSGDGGIVPVATSTQGTAAQIGLGAHSTQLTNGQVVTHVATAKGYRVTYRDVGTGTLTFRDGPGGTVLGTRVFTNTGKTLVWKSATNLSDAAPRTLHITSTGATNVGQIIPLRDTRVVSHYATHSGYTSADYTNNPNFGLDVIEWLEANGNLGLVVLATGANDGPYSTMMPALLAAIRARTTADVVLWVPYLSNAVQQAEYDLMHPVALASGLPLIDTGTYYARFAATWSLDGTHPGYDGQRILSAVDMMVLSGDPIGQLAKLQALAPKIGTAATDAAPGNVLTAERSSAVNIEDDFMLGDATLSGSIGALRWTRTNGTSVAVTLGVAGHPGAVRIQPTDVAANISTLSLGVAGVGDGNWVASFWIKTSAPGPAKFELGVTGGAGAFLHGIAFLWENTPRTTWQVVAKFLGTETARADTGVAPLTNTWQRFTLIKFGAAVIAQIDGVTVATIAGGAGSFLSVNVTNVAGGGPSQYVDVDRVQLGLTGIARPAVPA